MLRSKAGRLLALCGVALAGCAAAFLIRSFVHRPPEVVTAYHDFGFVYPDDVVSHRFTLANPCDRVLTLAPVTASCGCLALDMETRVLAPGEATGVTVRLATARNPGVRRETAMVEGRSGTRQVFFRFEVSATAAEVIELSSRGAMVRLGEFRLKDLPKRVTIRARRGTHPLDWDTLECAAGNSGLAATVLPKGPDRWDIDLIVKEPQAYGLFSSSLTFSFLQNGREQAYHYVKPVQWVICGPVMAAPQSLIFGVVRQGESVTKTVYFRPTEPGGPDVAISIV